MEKRAQSQVMVVVLLVLIGLVVVGIVWNFVLPLIRERSSEVGTSQITTSLEIEDVVLSPLGASFVTVKRGSDDGEISSLKFVFYDAEERSHIETKDDVIGSLETKTYNFNPISDLGFGKIESVSVIPVFGKTLGREFSGKANKVFRIPAGLVSWWRFNDASDVVGGNDGVGGVVSDGVLIDGDGFNVGDIDVEDEIAIGVWVNSRGGGSIIEKGNDYKISLEGGKVVFSGGGSRVESMSSLDSGVWNFILINLDSTGFYIWLNDDETPNQYVRGVYLSNSDAPVLIGSSFNGKIDEVMIFDQGLLPEQIGGLYNNFMK